jgi:hypothetical protein
MHDADAIDALTAKVNELARFCAQLSQENAELRHQVSALSALAAPAAGTLSGPQDLGQLAGRAATTRISRRAAVGVALAGAAAGIAGATALTERSGHADTPAAAASVASAELTAAEVAAAPPTTTGSVISATLSTASPVVAGVNTSTGPGLHATSTAGRGGIFAGAAAQIQLTPAGASHPRSGQRGDLYADAAGRLWYCKATGSAAWHQIA